MCISLQGEDRRAKPLQTNLRVRWSALAPPMQPWHQRMTRKRTRKMTRLSRMLMMMAAAAHLLPQGVPPQHPQHPPHPPPPVSQARLASVLADRALSGESAGIASGVELIQGRPESDAEDNVQAVENAEKRLKKAKPAPEKKDAPSKRPREDSRTEERKAVSDTEGEDLGPKKRVPKKSKPKTEPQVVDDSDDSEDHRRASSSRHKPVTSSAIYNAFDGAILHEVRRRFQTLIFVRDGFPVKTLTIHRHLNYKLTLKAAKDTMETVLYRQFKNAMEIAYKDTSKE